MQPIFGASLDEVVSRPENNLHNDSGTAREIPKLVEDAVKYLREKGMPKKEKRRQTRKKNKKGEERRRGEEGRQVARLID